MSTPEPPAPTPSATTATTPRAGCASEDSATRLLCRRCAHIGGYKAEHRVRRGTSKAACSECGAWRECGAFRSHYAPPASAPAATPLMDSLRECDEKAKDLPTWATDINAAHAAQYDRPAATPEPSPRHVIDCPRGCGRKVVVLLAHGHGPPTGAMVDAETNESHDVCGESRLAATPTESDRVCGKCGHVPHDRHCEVWIPGLHGGVVCGCTERSLDVASAPAATPEVWACRDCEKRFADASDAFRHEEAQRHHVGPAAAPEPRPAKAHIPWTPVPLRSCSQCGATDTLLTLTDGKLVCAIRCGRGAATPDQSPRCDEDTHYWPSHAPGDGPRVGAPCKCGLKTWPAATPEPSWIDEQLERERAIRAEVPEKLVCAISGGEVAETDSATPEPEGVLLTVACDACNGTGNVGPGQPCQWCSAKATDARPAAPTGEVAETGRLGELNDLLLRLYIAADSGTRTIAKGSETFSEQEMRTLEYFVGDDAVLLAQATALAALQRECDAAKLAQARAEREHADLRVLCGESKEQMHKMLDSLSAAREERETYRRAWNRSDAELAALREERETVMAHLDAEADLVPLKSLLGRVAHLIGTRFGQKVRADKAESELAALRARVEEVRSHIAEVTHPDCNGDNPQWGGGFRAACSQILAVLDRAALAPRQTTDSSATPTTTPENPT